jgi:glycine/D-amino acid oxidase-like deaminating enzyme
MDLRSGSAFWPIQNGLLQTYPTLREDASCEVVVIGAGITGALVAHRLTLEGADVMVLDRRDVASGSTSASTALLQYEIDTPLSKLASMIPESDALRAYRLGLEAINEIESLVGELGDSCGFTRRKSLQFASRQRDTKALREEYEMQLRHGFEVQYLEQSDLEQISSIRAPGAMISEGDAQVDPFRLTHRLLQSASQRGARVHDRTEVKSVKPEGAGITIKTSDGVLIHAKRVVFATGFESHQYLKQNVGKLLSTFVLITEPLETFQGWPEKALIWETANPYLYMRSTEDHRAIIGGEDVPFATAHRQAALVARKTLVLERRFKKLFPEIPFEVAYTWAGTFGETKDGLAYIGQTAEFPNAYFALGFGGNGITYSLTASRIIADLFFGRTNSDAHIYRFER